MAKMPYRLSVIKAGLVDSKKPRKSASRLSMPSVLVTQKAWKRKKRWQKPKQKTRERSKAQSRKATYFRREDAQGQYRTDD